MSGVNRFILNLHEAFKGTFDSEMIVGRDRPPLATGDTRRFFRLDKGPRYPGEGNRLTRRTAAKGQVRK